MVNSHFKVRLCVHPIFFTQGSVSLQVSDGAGNIANDYTSIELSEFFPAADANIVRDFCQSCGVPDADSRSQCGSTPFVTIQSCFAAQFIPAATLFKLGPGHDVVSRTAIGPRGNRQVLSRITVR